jgi:hypothetical protein
LNRVLQGNPSLPVGQGRGTGRPAPGQPSADKYPQFRISGASHQEGAPAATARTSTSTRSPRISLKRSSPASPSKPPAAHATSLSTPSRRTWPAPST